MWVIGAAEMAPPAAPHGRNVRLNNLTDIWGQNWTDLCGMKAGKLISGVRSPQLVKTPSTLLLFGQCRRASSALMDSSTIRDRLGDDMLHDRVVTAVSTDQGSASPPSSPSSGPWPSSPSLSCFFCPPSPSRLRLLAGLSWGSAAFISTAARGMGVGIYDRRSNSVVYQYLLRSAVSLFLVSLFLVHSLISCSHSVKRRFRRSRYQSFTQMNTYEGNRLLQRTSTDQGITWGAERDITHFVAPVCNTGPGGQVVGGAGSKLQASSGRLIFSGHSDSHAGGGICVWYSDDGGLTYNVSASGVFPGNENSIADLGNGTLYMNGRGYVFTWKGHRTSYWSHDNGAHWSPGVEVPEIEEPSSAGCQGSLLAVPRSIKRRGVSNYIPGDTAIPPRLFFAEPSGVRADGVRTGKDRISLRVWCSTDGGKTFPSFAAINTGDGAGYSAMEYVLQANGEPLLVRAG